MTDAELEDVATGLHVVVQRFLILRGYTVEAAVRGANVTMAAFVREHGTIEDTSDD